ncbi:acyclic terpene utilization AtuA family protein [Mycobacterium sp. NPDC003449]
MASSNDDLLVGSVPRRPVRIGNASAFYGDRSSSMRLLIEGGDVDVITGDYLAELTMLILWKARQKDPDTGWARTFLSQLGEVIEACAQRRLKVVVNAGGLNPAGLADAVRTLIADSGLALQVAHVEGDDLMPVLPQLRANGLEFRHLDTGRSLTDAAVRPVTANAYLGGWGITAALSGGADVVITGRVTDAALVVGVGAWWHCWDRDDFDALAGAVAAGHVIECGPQATGGNYARMSEVDDRRCPGSPIAELAHDGSFVVTKHKGTGGLVTTGTVTAQLLYEVASPAYINPDVVSHFDSLSVTQDGPDRVLVSGAKGSPPPADLKVAMNYIGGYRNTMTMVLTGLDIEEKSDWAIDQLFEILGGRKQFDEVDVQLLRYDRAEPRTFDESTAHLKVTVKSTERAIVDRPFSNAVTELAVAGYAGFHTTTPPSSAREFGVYWPTVIPASYVEHRVVHADGTIQMIDHIAYEQDSIPGQYTSPNPPFDFGPTSRRPLGTVVGARSGDKGGNANVGVWTDRDDRWRWLSSTLTVEFVRHLLDIPENLEVRRYDFANLKGVNFVIVGLLGDGVASCTRTDPQAKGLGEYLRACRIAVPNALL